MNLPDFIIIGAAKSGTTTLFKYLSNNPVFFVTTPKEPEFFARDEIYNNGIEWYSNLFSGAKDSQISCEASTLYSLYPLFDKTAERMHAAVPGAKLVYVMRNPVKRAYSYYIQLIKNYQNSSGKDNYTKTFEEFLFDNSDEVGKKNSAHLASFDNHLPYGPDLLLSGGLYVNQINEYLKYYDRKSLYLMVFEDFILDPVKELNKLYDFLEIDINNKDSEFTEARENISKEHFHEKATQSLIRKFQSIPLVGKIAKLLPGSMKEETKKILSWFTSFSGAGVKAAPNKMKDETNRYLIKYYRKPTEQLSELMGRDMVSFWSLDK